MAIVQVLTGMVGVRPGTAGPNAELAGFSKAPLTFVDAPTPPPDLLDRYEAHWHAPAIETAPVALEDEASDSYLNSVTLQSGGRSLL